MCLGRGRGGGEDTVISEGPCPGDPSSNPDKPKALRLLVSSVQQTSDCTMLIPQLQSYRQR